MLLILIAGTAQAESIISGDPLVPREAIREDVTELLEDTQPTPATPEEEKPIPAQKTAIRYPQKLTPGIPADWDKNVDKRHVANFAVKFKDEVSPLHTVGMFVLPGETVDLETLFERRNADYRLYFSAGTAKQTKRNRWQWQAPNKPGAVKLIISEQPIDESRYGEDHIINTFVMVPSNQIKNERLEGYRIGTYPTEPLRGNPKYLPPKGFIRVTKANEDTLISPHFRLKQFLCKQAGGYPKFIVLQERLLLKLERIVDKAKAEGFPIDTLHIMSGYRTPFYNQQIGNVKYSRHQWGGAADIFIDLNPRNGRMDDLNADGKTDVADARVIYQWITEMTKNQWYAPFIGGMGLYAANTRRGAFIHVDVRGSLARW